MLEDGLIFVCYKQNIFSYLMQDTHLAFIFPDTGEDSEGSL